MSNKSAYEIRSDLLALSFKILLAEKEDQIRLNDGSTIKSPNVDDVIAKAKKLNEFVSNPDQA